MPPFIRLGRFRQIAIDIFAIDISLMLIAPPHHFITADSRRIRQLLRFSADTLSPFQLSPASHSTAVGCQPRRFSPLLIRRHWPLIAHTPLIQPYFAFRH